MTYFAERLKKLRTQLGLSMQALADQASVSKSMICKIENDEVQPTIDVAARLARALGQTLSEMLHTPQAAQVMFLSKDEQAVWEDAQQVKRRNISPIFEGLKIEWLQVELPPHTSTLMMKHMTEQKTEKFILVTKGTLNVKVGEETFHLKKGDSLYFDTGAHEFFNPGKETAEYYAVLNHGKS
ncbi:MAG: XRE family transcriptional regulator [Gammaproteobacteria bacterium]|nr:MAG: XRE family transcriptional regulator [Gammaproteobacteria bacterium]